MNKLTLIVRSNTHPASRVQKHQNKWIQIVLCLIRTNLRVLIVTIITVRLWLRSLQSIRRDLAQPRTSSASQIHIWTEATTITMLTMEAIMQRVTIIIWITLTTIIGSRMHGAIRWLILVIKATIWCKTTWTIMTRTIQRVRDWVDCATCRHPLERSPLAIIWVVIQAPIIIIVPQIIRAIQVVRLLCQAILQLTIGIHLSKLIIISSTMEMTTKQGKCPVLRRLLVAVLEVQDTANREILPLIKTIIYLLVRQTIAQWSLAP